MTTGNIHICQSMESTRQEVTSIPGIDIHAGVNALPLIQDDCAHIERITITTFEKDPAYIFDLSPRKDSSKEKVKQMDYSIDVNFTDRNKESRMVTFTFKSQWIILAKYLNGQITPEKACKEFLNKGILEISYAQDRTESQIYNFFILSHPGYTNYFAKDAHRIYQAQQ